MLALFRTLHEEVVGVSPSMGRRLGGLCVTFGTCAGFISIIPRGSQLHLSLGMTFTSVLSPGNLYGSMSGLKQ